MNTTRAPWHVSGDISSAVDVYAGTIRIAMLDDEVEIPDHELIANARLIAAAPALYSALAELHLAVTMRPSGSGGLSQRERAALDSARAAIARATGDQTITA